MSEIETQLVMLSKMGSCWALEWHWANTIHSLVSGSFHWLIVMQTLGVEDYLKEVER